MNKNILIDTDIIIDYLRGVPQATEFLEGEIKYFQCYISAITVAELYAGVKEGNERRKMESFLKIFDIVDIDAPIASHGGIYRRDFGRSHGMGLADALIAASADACHATLITLNKKHFPMLKTVEAPYTKG